MSKTSKKRLITIEEIMTNQPWEIYIKNIGKVLARDPTKGNRIEARLEASKMKIWDQLSDIDKTLEIQNRVALKMLVEPKIGEEQYLNAPDSKITRIIDAVSLEYSKRIAKLGEERKKQLASFLFQLVGKEELLKMIGEKA